jgi:hypothetical protein
VTQFYDEGYAPVVGSWEAADSLGVRVAEAVDRLIVIPNYRESCRLTKASSEEQVRWGSALGT